MADEARYLYTRAGQGSPLLLIPGFCENHEVFDPILPALAERADVVAVTLPGFGGLPANPQIRQLDDFAFWLRDFLDHLGWERCVVVGHSMGGYVALGMAAHFPERLLGLGLLHSTALSDPPEKQQNRTKSMGFIAQNGKEAFLRTFVPSLFHDPAADWLEELYRITRQAEEEAMIACTRMMRDRPDRTEVAANLKVPFMYIVGEHDTLVPPARNQEELMKVGMALVHRIPEAGHMGMFEAPEKVVRAISSLL